MKISSVRFLPAFFLALMFFAIMLTVTFETEGFTIVTHLEDSTLRISGSAKGNASQEVLLLRGWLKSWPVRSIASQTASASSFFCFLLRCHEGSSVSDFPLQTINYRTELQKATQLVVRVASLTQDIAAV